MMQAGPAHRASWSGSGMTPATGCPTLRGPAGSRAAALVPPPRAFDAVATSVDVLGVADRLARSVQQELVMESVLHTTVGTSMQCLRKYGLELAEAPPLADVRNAAPMEVVASLAASDDDSGGVASKAACLATPAEPVDEGNGANTARAALARLRAPGGTGGGAAEPHRAVGGGASSLARGAAGAGALEAEDAFCQVELWQRRVALLECGEMAAEYLQKSGPVRRRRRLALVRAVREARDGAKGLILAIRNGPQKSEQKQQQHLASGMDGQRA